MSDYHDEMIKQGYVYAQGLDLSLYRYLNLKHKALLDGVFKEYESPLGRAQSMAYADKLLRKAQDHGEKLLQLKRTTNNSPSGITSNFVEFWIPQEIYRLLCLLTKTPNLKFDGGSHSKLFTDEQMALLVDYHEHPEWRENILGLLEAATEVDNGDSLSPAQVR